MSRSHKATILGSLVFSKGSLQKCDIYMPLSPTEIGRLSTLDINKELPDQIRAANEQQRSVPRYLTIYKGDVCYGRGRSTLSSRMSAGDGVPGLPATKWHYRGGSVPAHLKVSGEFGATPGTFGADSVAGQKMAYDDKVRIKFAEGVNRDGAARLIMRNAMQRTYGGRLLYGEVVPYGRTTGTPMGAQIEQQKGIARTIAEDAAATGRIIISQIVTVDAYPHNNNTLLDRLYTAILVSDVTDEFPGCVRAVSVGGGNTPAFSWDNPHGNVSVWRMEMDPRLYDAYLSDGITFRTTDGVTNYSRSSSTLSDLEIIPCFVAGAPSWAENWHIGKLKTITRAPNPFRVTVDESDGLWLLLAEDTIRALCADDPDAPKVPAGSWVVHGSYPSTREFTRDPVRRTSMWAEMESEDRDEFMSTVFISDGEHGTITTREANERASGRRFREVVGFVPTPSLELTDVPDLRVDASGGRSMQTGTELEWLSAFIWRQPYLFNAENGASAADIATVINDGVAVSQKPALPLHQFDGRYWLKRSDILSVDDASLMVGLQTFALDDGPLLDAVRAPYAYGALERQMFSAG